MSSPARDYVFPRNGSTGSLPKFGSYDNLSSLAPEDNASEMLDTMSTVVFDDKAMAHWCGKEAFDRFKRDVKSGNSTSPEDQSALAAGMFAWAKEQGAVCFAHWFFPMRGGGGAVGGTLGALKQDAFIDLDWTSEESIKPFEARTSTPGGHPVSREACPREPAEGESKRTLTRDPRHRRATRQR